MANPHIDPVGTKRWLLNGNVHRTDGSDDEYVLHRTDGPAIEYANGRKGWYLNDDRHRTDGPAIEWADGQMDWYLNGRVYSFDEWLELNPDLTDGEKVMMKLQYG
jgi:hypothetical protein